MTFKAKRGYRSRFEKSVGAVLEPAGFSYEPCKIYYTMPGTYTPDFVMGRLIVECKGYFRPGDTKKYKAIRDSLKGSRELVFLLQCPFQRVRKGNKITMAEWCDKEGIRWFATPEEVIEYANVG